LSSSSKFFKFTALRLSRVPGLNRKAYILASVALITLILCASISSFNYFSKYALFSAEVGSKSCCPVLAIDLRFMMPCSYCFNFAKSFSSASRTSRLTACLVCALNNLNFKLTRIFPLQNLFLQILDLVPAWSHLCLRLNDPFSLLPHLFNCWA
jgi:hypothetical protein